MYCTCRPACFFYKENPTWSSINKRNVFFSNVLTAGDYLSAWRNQISLLRSQEHCKDYQSSTTGTRRFTSFYNNDNRVVYSHSLVTLLHPFNFIINLLLNCPQSYSTLLFRQDYIVAPSTNGEKCMDQNHFGYVRTEPTTLFPHHCMFPKPTAGSTTAVFHLFFL
jgi:hypothetical protein